LERSYRWCKRKPALVALIATMISLLLTLTVVVLWVSVAEIKYANRLANAYAKHTLAQVDALCTASPDVVPLLIETLRQGEDTAVPYLRAIAADDSADAIHRLRSVCALALLNQEDPEIRRDLIESVGMAPDDESCNVIAATRTVRDRQNCIEELTKQWQATEDHVARVRYAATALHLADAVMAQEMLALGSDPSQRTAFVGGFRSWRGELSGVHHAMKRIEDPAFRSGMCLALGRIPVDRLDSEAKQQLQSLMEDWYETSLDTGTHSAANWALRQWGAELPDLPASNQPVGERDWHVNHVGMTMLRIPAGTYFRPAMAPPNPKVTLTRDYFMSAREVSLGCFLDFVADEAYSEYEADRAEKVSLTPDHPAAGITWFDAVQFCNWLSAKDGRTPCYTKTGEKEQLRKEQYDVWHCNRYADGYRLPTLAEWRYACVAGTRAAYSFGNDDSSLAEYAVYGADATEMRGSKLPNQLGLFDMYGNVAEWCQDGFWVLPKQDLTDPVGPERGDNRYSIGGSFADRVPEFIGSWSGSRSFPGSRIARQHQGFRVVRTCPGSGGPVDEPDPVKALPDLQILGVHLNNGRVTTIFLNQGRAAAEEFIVQVIADKETFAFVTIRHLDIGINKRLESSSLPAGVHTVEVRIDPDDRVHESNEDNNSHQVELEGAASASRGREKLLPDLCILDVTLERGYLRAIVRNQGIAPSEAFSVRFAVDGKHKGNYTARRLDVDSVLKATSGRLPAGTHTVEVRVDPDNEIREIDETNNIMRMELRGLENNDAASKKAVE
jgi:formylglycine-generating enzyme required for sulfatase activity